MNEPARHETERDERAERIVRPARDLRDPQKQNEEEGQRDSHPEESHLFADHGENEIGMLLRKERETLLCAQRESLAEHSTRTDGNLRLDDVIARRLRIRRRIDEHLQSILLIWLQLLPHNRSNDSRRDVHDEQNHALEEIRPVIENQCKQHQEPSAPHSCAERKNQAYDGTREEKQQRPGDARPVKHSKKDSDEHDARAEIRLEHDDEPRNADDQRRLP